MPEGKNNIEKCDCFNELMIKTKQNKMTQELKRKFLLYLLNPN